MVENGKGITFIPELALPQLPTGSETDTPLRHPHTDKRDYHDDDKELRKACRAQHAHRYNKSSVPENMLKLNNTEQRV